MNANSCWLSGPSFLRSEEKEWPCQDLLKHHPLVFSIQPPEAPKRSTQGCLINIALFSNWNRLIRVTAHCFFFGDFCKKRSKHLALCHHTFAYRYLIQVSQIENIANKISALRKGKDFSESSCLKDLVRMLKTIISSAPKSGCPRQWIWKFPDTQSFWMV